jgi:FkbM family methyltransferase
MKIDPSRSMGSSIYWTGFHEFKEMMFLGFYLKEDMVFLDIGANQGEYTLFAAKRLKKGLVISFEPVPFMIERLENNIKLNVFENIRLMHYALSDKEGLLPIYDLKDNHEGLATFYSGDNKILREYHVPVKVLNDEFEKFAVDRVDFIKIDIEGGELPALRGADRVIRKFKPVIMVEINDATFKAAGYTSSDVLTFFSDLNYTPHTLGKSARLTRCQSLPSFGNVIFIPE